MSIFCSTFAMDWELVLPMMGQKCMMRREMDNKPYMTPEGWKRPVGPMRHHRETHWDYKGRGIYHVTLVVEKHYPLFGQLAGDSPENAYVELNSFGKQVLEKLQDTPRQYAEKGYAVKILASQIMPDHVHIAIQALEQLPKSIGMVIRGFKSACTSLYKREYATGCPDNGTKGYDEERKERNIMQFSRIFTRTGTIWEQRPEHYHERILHPNSNISDMIAYIQDNPRRLAMKRTHPDLFKIQEHIIYKGMEIRVMGNRFLLDKPMKEAFHCSRTLEQKEIEVLRNQCLAKAEEGTIFICAAISEGEKLICRSIREHGLPLIIILAEGFPDEKSEHYPYFKPTGVYFEACAEGRLLLIEPSRDWLESPEITKKTEAKVGNIPRESKRWRFVAMNYIAEMLA